MQISRHWRLNAIRYRLEGFQNSSAQKTLMARPVPVISVDDESKPVTSEKICATPVATAA